jgi:hypothetical protein
MQLSTSTRAALAHDLGPDLHRWSRVVATAVAFTYVAGMAAGELVHWLNDRLAGGRRPWPVRLGSMFDAKPVAVTEPALTLDGAGRIRHFVAPLSHLSVAELRQIARDKRIYPGRPVHLARRADLIAAIVRSLQ